MRQLPNVGIHYTVHDSTGKQVKSGSFRLNDTAERRAFAERTTQAHLDGFEVRTRIPFANPAKKRQRPVCDGCGSDQVTADSVSVWDMERQEWVTSNIYDDGHSCENCNDECGIEFEDVP